MIVLSIVFSLFLKIDVENYPLFVFSGLLPWTFFSLSITSGTQSLINNRDLIKKVSFPRILIPISAVLAHTFTFLLAFGLLLLFVIISQGFNFQLIFLIPLIVLETVLVIALSLILSSLDIYYRDVSFILQAGILLWFYLTPIFYPISFVPKEMSFFYQLNPMVGIITSYQSILLNKNFILDNSLFVTLVETLILIIIGIIVFSRRSKYFADWV